MMDGCGEFALDLQIMDKSHIALHGTGICGHMPCCIIMLQHREDSRFAAFMVPKTTNIEWKPRSNSCDIIRNTVQDDVAKNSWL